MNMILKYTSVAVGVAVFAFIGNKAIDAFVQHGKTIQTDGVAFKKVESDYAVLNIIISNDTNVINEIGEKRKADKKAVLDFLAAQGVEESEITDDGVNVEDQLRYVNDKVEGKKKFKVTDTIKVKTSKAKLIEKMMANFSELLEKNICLDTRVEYTYQDMKKLRAEISDEAVKEAKERAEYIAKNSNMAIGKLRSVTVDKFSIAGADKSEVSPNSYGDWEEGKSISKKVSATVKAVFDLE